MYGRQGDEGGVKMGIARGRSVSVRSTDTVSKRSRSMTEGVW